MLVDTPAKLDDFLDELAAQTLVAYDTETSGLRIWDGDQICGMAFAFADGRTFYLPVRHRLSVPHIDWVKEKTDRGGTSRRRVVADYFDEREFDQLHPSAIRRVFEVVLENGIELICHNAKFDVHVTENERLDLSGVTIYDTMVMARIANNIELSTKLKQLGRKYINPDAGDEESVLKKMLRARGWLFRDPDSGKDIAHYDWTLPTEMAPYAEKDVELTYALYRRLLRVIVSSGQQGILQRETELLPVIVEMERRGMRVDLDFCRKSLVTVNERLAIVEESIYALAGGEFDIASTKQLGDVMRRLGVESAVKTPGGADSWAKKAIEPSKGVSPIVDYVLAWRALDKIRGTYLGNYLHFADERGIIHADVRQNEAKTGRTSIADPSLQNVTRDEREGIRLRECFIPREGYVWLLIDWSQMEARIVADWAGETWLLELIESGGDIHSQMALRIAAVRGEDACGDVNCASFKKKRYAAKTVFFGLVYGMGVKLLMTTLGITEEEAATLRSAFWEVCPNIAAFFRATVNEAKRNGLVRNKYDRVYRCPEIRDPRTGAVEYGFTYAAVDWKIQGTGADMAKQTMIRVWRAFRKAKLDAGLIGFIHDELVIECRPEDVDRIAAGVMRIMSDFGDLFRVPIVAEASVAVTSWADKKPHVPAAVAA